MTMINTISSDGLNYRVIKTCNHDNITTSWTTPTEPFKLHRTNGPAWVKECLDGSVIKEWWQNGKRHRLNGPARIKKYIHISYKDNKKHIKNVTIEEWRHLNKVHRTDGPAYIRYENDNIVDEIYWVHNDNLSKKEFDQRRLAGWHTI